MNQGHGCNHLIDLVDGYTSFMHRATNPTEGFGAIWIEVYYLHVRQQVGFDELDQLAWIRSRVCPCVQLAKNNRRNMEIACILEVLSFISAIPWRNGQKGINQLRDASFQLEFPSLGSGTNHGHCHNRDSGRCTG